MTRLASRVLILSGAIVVLGSFVPWKRFLAYGAFHRYHILQVAPTTFTETKSSGLPRLYRILQAKIQTDTNSDTKDLEIYARNLFEGSLKFRAEEQHVEMVWVTFYFADNPDQLHGIVKTFRDIYICENGNWHRFQPTVGQPT